jgi:hypothetical protein
MKFKITAEQQVHLYKIAVKMSEIGHSAQFITELVSLAGKWKDAYNEMIMWEKEDMPSKILRYLQKNKEENMDDVEERLRWWVF